VEEFTRKPSFPFFPVFMALAICGVVTGLMLRSPDVGPTPGTEAERGQFMIECVADWQFKPSTCRRILAGELPPEKPDGIGEPGC
jgi:hypothetical protein